MQAYIEVYGEHKSIVKIEDDDGNVVDRFEVDQIRVEMPAGYIAATSKYTDEGKRSRRQTTTPLILISGARN